jgi:hypothetical protein
MKSLIYFVSSAIAWNDWNGLILEVLAGPKS